MKILKKGFSQRRFIFAEGENAMDAKVSEKYGRSYFMPPEVTYDLVKKDIIEKPPVW